MEAEIGPDNYVVLWSVVSRAGGDPARFTSELMQMSREEVLRLYVEYVDARTELVDYLHVRGANQRYSEDELDDMADLIIAAGKGRYMEVFSGGVPPSHDAWIGRRSFVGVVYSNYHDRFGGDIVFDSGL